MPNQNNSIPKSYDAGDMLDVYSCAESDMQWMFTALTDTRIRVKKLKAELAELNASSQYYFYGLEQVLEMYEYLAETRFEYHAEEVKRYSKEWEQLKGGRNA